MEGTFKVEIDADKRRGIGVFTGIVRAEEMRGAMDALFGATEWDVQYDILWDLSRIDSVDVKLDDLIDLVRASRKLTESGQSGRAAMVASSTEIAVLGKYLAAKMASFGRTARVFSKRGDAEAWLDG